MAKPEKTTELSAEQKAYQESLKLLFEVYKHITTVSTAAILVIAAFLEKFFKEPKHTYFITYSLLSFLACLVTCLLMMMHLALALRINREPDNRERAARGFLYLISPILFIFGIVCLMEFVVKNLSN